MELNSVALLSAMLLLSRIAAFITTFPTFGGKNVPPTIRVGLAMCLTLAWVGNFSPVAGDLLQEEVHWSKLAVALLPEIAIGAILGFGCSLIMLSMRLAGEYLAQEIGLSIAGVTDASGQSSTTPMGSIWDVLGVLAFFCTDAHHMVLRLVEASLTISEFDITAAGTAGLAMSELVGRGYHLAIVLIGPAAVGLMVLGMGLLVLMKTAPQINLFSVGAPVRLIVGLGIVLSILPYALNLFSNTNGSLVRFLSSLLGIPSV